jgi:hypothetical protein
MLWRIVVPTLVGTLFLVTGCENSEPASPSTGTPTFAQGGPATGNGNKEVVLIDERFPVECPGGEILEVHLSGWFQARLFPQPNNRNAQLTVFHQIITFTNTAGETFVFTEVGPDHAFFEDGILYVAVVGRLGGGLIGRLVFNPETGEDVFVAGKEFEGVEALACEALT